MVVKPSISGHGFEVGDMVWAKIKSQPWWPGYVFNEQFATPLVRQSKRDNLLLVSFFGASTYGWFDPEDLIPFDSNYAEKSLQTNSRAFVRAVKDAIREVNRRIGLGLSCMCCNNKQNFRATDVQRSVSADVAGHDPGTVYSIDVIKKTRVSFQPKLTADFIMQLGLEPTVSEDIDIGFIKNKATVMAYRKAVYEDFDQAFGYDPVCTSIQKQASRKMSSKAPLNSREFKNTAKLKDHFKIDDSKETKEEKEEVTSSFLPVAFKDPTITAAAQFTLKDETVSLEDISPTVVELSDACVEMINTCIVESSTSSSVAEVDQAKVRSASAKKSGQPESPQRIDDNYKTEVSRVLNNLLSLAVDPCNTTNRGSRINIKKAFLRFRSLVFQKGQNFSPQPAGGTVEVPPDPVKPQGGLKRGPSVRLEEMAVAKRKKVDDIRILTKEKKVTKKIDEPRAPVRDVNQQAVDMVMKKPGPEPTMLMMKFPHGGFLPSFSELNAQFARYGPLDDSFTQIFENTYLCRVVFRHKAHAQAAYKFVVRCSSLFGNTDVKCKLKAVESEPPPVIVPQEDHHQLPMEDRSPSIIPVSSGVHLKVSGGEDAAAAANGGEEVVVDSLGDVMTTAKHKDHVSKESTGVSRVLSDLQSLAVDPFNIINKGSCIEGKKAFLKFRSLAFQKSQNLSLPLAAVEPNASKLCDDRVEVPPVKPQGGLKRALSDHHEEMNLAKRKKTEPQAPQPTMLMIKFPKGGSLPSLKDLKARFACYGPMDHSGTHIFWNTFSCQVVFTHKAHAQAAYTSAVESSSLFGNTGVKCTLKKVRTVGSVETEPPPPPPLVKVRKEDHHRQLDMEDRPPKSILKKSGGEEAAGSGVRGRVKFTCTSDSSPPSLPPHSTQMTPLRVLNRSLNVPPLMTPNADIGQQMLSLLTRCNDVVIHISSILGYKPYHPL